MERRLQQTVLGWIDGSKPLTLLGHSLTKDPSVRGLYDAEIFL